jgi:hypothetical protein
MYYFVASTSICIVASYLYFLHMCTLVEFLRRILKHSSSPPMIDVLCSGLMGKRLQFGVRFVGCVKAMVATSDDSAARRTLGALHGAAALQSRVNM